MHGLNKDESPWLEGRVPNGYWDLRENRIQYMDWLAGRCGFVKPEDWYEARKADFKGNRGGGLLCTQYDDSVYEALQDYRPEFEWVPWRFHTAPKKFWDNPGNRRSYMDWLGDRIGVQQPADWYGVTGKTFRQNYGGGLLRGKFGDSVLAAVSEYLPDYPWLPWMFREAPNSYWQHRENRQAYMKWLGAELGFQAPEDWYAATKESFYDNFGAGLLRNHFNDSPQRAVAEYLPDLTWTPWLFTSVPQHFWQDVDRRLAYLRWLGQRLNFGGAADWYRLTTGDFKRHRGGGLLGFYADGTLGQALSEVLRQSRTGQRAVIWPMIQLIECSITDRDPQGLFLALA